MIPYFKHQYITQQTLTPEDIMVKSILDLQHTIQKSKDKKGDVNFEAIKKLQSIFNSREMDAAAPRVEATDPRVNDAATDANCHVPTKNDDCSIPRVPPEVEYCVSHNEDSVNNTTEAARK